MAQTDKFYIDGAWVSPLGDAMGPVVNPATGETIATVAWGETADVDRAVRAARAAFPTYSAMPITERVSLLRCIAEVFQARKFELEQAVTAEMGSPADLSDWMQTDSSVIYFNEAADTAEQFEFEQPHGTSRLRYEAIGVAGLITPWNWPLNQIVTKLAPALAAGCTVVLKPSEISPLSALLLAEVLDEAGVPAGVFNLINGSGKDVGDAIARHADIDLVSFTGSTRAGIAVAQAAAPTVKRVHQELGGKSASLILPDADLDLALADSVARIFINSGQSCIAPSRMLIPRAQQADIHKRLLAEVAKVRIGDPTERETTMGPVSCQAQWDRVQLMIKRGIAEGARVLCGGLGRPEGIERGVYVRPTIFVDVTNDMSIARDEIFGPVLSVIAYDTVDEAIEIANDSNYGLAGYVYGKDADIAEAVARQLRAGRIFINNPPFDFSAPFGGYKQSGNGRELGLFGLTEYLEVKAMLGHCN